MQIMNFKAIGLYDLEYYTKKLPGAEEYFSGKIRPFYVKIISLIKKRIRRRRKKLGKKRIRVLDIGCGRGEILLLVNKELKEYNVDSVGIDISEAAVKIAKEHGEVVQCDCCKLPFRNGVFHIITCLEVIEHLSEKQQLHLLNEVFRIIEINGLFLITTPNKYWRIFRALVEFYKHPLRGYEIVVKYKCHVPIGHIRELGPLSFLMMLLKSGFTPILCFMKPFKVSLKELASIPPLLSPASLWGLFSPRKKKA